MQSDWCPYKKEKFGHRDTHTGQQCEQRSQLSTSQEVKPGVDLSPQPLEGAKLADTLILNF
jgi:hypothetical protein